MTVTIKDLPKNEELDRKAMAAARGGMATLAQRGIIIHGLSDRGFEDPEERVGLSNGGFTDPDLLVGRLTPLR